jgi:RecJ-like exonuclease
MEKRSGEAVSKLDPVRQRMREGRTSADEIIAGGRTTGVQYSHRPAGINEGSYAVTCDLCQGTGIVRIATRPAELCHKCDGVGALVIQDIAEERRKKTAKLLAWIMVSATAAAVIALIVIWYSFRP